MKLARLMPAVLLVSCLLASAAGAARLGTGKSVVWLGLNGNQTQLVGPTTGLFDPTTRQIVTGQRFEEGEVGLHAAYSYFLSDAWTLVLSGGFDVGRETFEPAPGVSEGPSRDKQVLSSFSWNARVGFDRYAFINDDVALYAGPGLLIWDGSGEFDGSRNPAIDIEWPETHQVGFNGRFGMYARFAPHYALFGHIGQVIAHNIAKDDAGKNTWWSNHHEGSVGLAVDY